VAHRLQVSTADITEDLRAQHGARPEGAWRTGDWVQIHLGAREFGAQQLRRITGMLVALVRGVEGDEYLRRCFDPRQQVSLVNCL
jgi:tRNA U38,U39,U40 pseudouridine synthase TruA